MPRSLLLPLVCAFLVPATASAQAPPPSAAPQAAAPDREEMTKKQVRELVRQAGQMMDRGDRQGAVSCLLSAQALRPDPSLDYNLGAAYAEMGKRPEAAAALSRFLARVRPEAVTADRIQDARQRLDAYRKDLARVRVDVGAADPHKVVLLDQRTVPAAEEQWLEPGSHDLRITAPGARDYRVSLLLSKGEERTVTAQLDPLPAGRDLALVPQSTARESPPLYHRWQFWAAVGGTAGAAAVIGLIAAGATGALNHKAPGSDLNPVDVAR